MLITLLDSRQVDTADILFDAGAMKSGVNGGGSPVFTLAATGEDLDNQIRQADMSNFSGWNVSDWLYWRSAHPVVPGATPVTGEPLTTDTTAIFAGQILTDPLSAPADMISGAVKSIESAAQKPMTWVIAGILGIGAVYVFTRK